MIRAMATDPTSRMTPARARRPGRTAWRLALGLAAMTAAAYAATAVMEIPPPHTLWRLEASAPSRRGDLLPVRVVPASATPSALAASAWPPPATVPWKGAEMPFDQFLHGTATNALVVLRDGRLVYEWYRPGVNATDPQSSWSMAKSVVSLLVGQAIARGELREDDRLVALLPELAGAGDYDRITVRQLLDMASGIDVSENYRAYWPFTGTARMYLTRDLAGFVRAHRRMHFTPGSAGDYRSIDTQLLGMALARVTGKPLADLLAERLWHPMGAESAATWNLDRPGGIEKAFCCLNATARDFARIGQQVLLAAQGQGVVPAAWLARIARPAPHAVDGWGYAAQWWQRDPAGGPDFAAVGIHGQYLYVHPGRQVVIVKLSDYGENQDERETYDALRALAQR
ncbi:6-aminohexanoate-dimer hydrolase [Achromobacter xylosoxidans]|nr:6-aminohexanoate-dimer hydrolase [Achromobacter xylosoxidans]